MNYSGDRKVLKYAGYSHKMDNMDDPETNAKISDSAYSNSCSNSQSRRSHSSKSTHSGSNSSGSSGYGGKASTSGSSNILGQPPKKDKESKKKKLQTEVKTADAVSADEPVRSAEPDPIIATPMEDSDNVNELAMGIVLPEKIVKDKESSTPEPSVANEEVLNVIQPDVFSFVVSMHDGVIINTSDSITSAIGFPKEIWIGRYFIDFLHPKDHSTFSSLIRNWLIFPKFENEHQSQEEGDKNQVSRSTMLCRIRRYKSLNLNYGVKDTVITFTPFLLKFFFKDYSDDDPKVIRIHIQAIYVLSAFKTANELVTKPTSFMFRHAADGILEYIDPESVPYLGYLPQDIKNKSALHLFHPDDLPYLKQVYERIVKEEKVTSSKPYRLMTQNGDYITVETEWSTVINPWSMKLDFVIAKHQIIEGPANPDVFQSPAIEKSNKISESEKYRIQAYRDRIIRIMNEVRNNPANNVKEVIDERCQNLVSFIETLIAETPKQEEELRLQIREMRELGYYERDSVMLGGISPHHDSDSKSSTETPLSYNQLNYNENLQRYFDSQEPHCYENCPTFDVPNNLAMEVQQPSSSKCFSPMAQNSDEFNIHSTNSSAVALCLSSPSPNDYQYAAKLTENMIYKISRTALNRHNAEMEKELVKMHRESRSSKGDREKATNESRIHKKEHLARCNALFHPTTAEDPSLGRHRQKEKSRGVKRASMPQYNDNHMQKHHCPSPKEPHRRHYPGGVPVSFVPSVTRISSTQANASQWSTPQNVNSYNVYGYGMPNQMQMMAHMLVPSKMPTMPTTSAVPNIVGLPSLSAASTMLMSGTSSMAPRPGTSAMPGAYAILGTPGMQGMPGTLRMQEMPGISGMQGMPGISRMQGMPGIPVMQGMPGSLGMPVSPGMQRMPRAPVMQGMPGSTGMQRMPGAPVMQGMPGSPGMQRMPGALEMQGMPGIQGMQGMPGALEMQGVTGMPGIPGMSGVPGMPGMPGLPAAPGVAAMPLISVPYMVHGHPVSMMYAQPYVYSPINPQMYSMQQNILGQQPMHYTNTFNLPTSNYEQCSGQSSDFVTSSSTSHEKSKNTRTSDENTDKTDGESSYSSFYSSFFRTDSGSADDSGDQNKKTTDSKNKFWTKNVTGQDAISFQSSTDGSIPFGKRNNRKLVRRKMKAPWNEEVNMTPDLIYRYQLSALPIHEVLEADKKKIEAMDRQPFLVNEQLGQLYLDLQLQGVAERLTLEEGITSSSSSGEETTSKTDKVKRKREFNKLAIIHEENAPIPSPGSGLLAPEGPPDEDIVPTVYNFVHPST